MATKASIISGEAPESDEEVQIKTSMSFPSLLVSSSCGTMIQGEAQESDDESNISRTLDPSTCSYAEIKVHKAKSSCVKYNSLLHKKLRECNKSLDKNVRETLKNVVCNSVDQLVETNKRLLKSELVLQDTVCKLQESNKHFQRTFDILQRTLDEDYFYNIKLG